MQFRLFDAETAGSGGWNASALDALRKLDEQMLKQLRQQQTVIDALRALVCRSNPRAKVREENE